MKTTFIEDIGIEDVELEIERELKVCNTHKELNALIGMHGVVITSSEDLRKELVKTIKRINKNHKN